MAEIKKLLDDAIETEINNLNSASNKDEKSEVIKNLAALHKLRIEEIKTETEIEEKSERRAMDKAAHDEDATLKAFQLDENKDAEDKEGLDGFQYDEYCVEVESWPGLAASVRENYDTYLAKGKDNEVDRSNYALFRAQKNTDSIVQDTDAMSVDHEYRLTLLELGLSE